MINRGSDRLAFLFSARDSGLCTPRAPCVRVDERNVRTSERASELRAHAYTHVRMLPRNIIAVIRWNWGSPALTRVLEASTWLLRNPPSREFLFLDFSFDSRGSFLFIFLLNFRVFANHEVQKFHNHDYAADFFYTSIESRILLVLFMKNFWKICVKHHTAVYSWLIVEFVVSRISFENRSCFANLYFILLSVRDLVNSYVTFGNRA